MSKQITITLPEGYEEPYALILVAPGTYPTDYPAYMHVLAMNPDGTVRAEEEVGGGTLRQVLKDVPAAIERLG